MLSNRNIFAAFAVALPAVLAQTSTDCNPMLKGCSPDTALGTSSFASTWTSASSLGNGWSIANGKVGFGADGAQFVINGAGDSPTIQSDFYFFFGSLEVTMKSSPGVGIVSSIVLLSDTLDEIDWEFIGGDATQTQTNYFGKGNTTTYDRAIWYPVNAPHTTEHTYTVDWTAESITWAIDGTVVRTLPYAAANGGTNFPQTPMRVRLGSWAGGAPGNPEGTIEWAGGQTDFSQAPFTMSIASVKITNYSPGSQYVYTDTSGSYESIEVLNVNGAKGTAGGVFAPSETSIVPVTSSTTTAAGTTVKPSSTEVAMSIRPSTVTTGAQLTSIPLLVSSSHSSTSSHSSSRSSSHSSSRASSTVSTSVLVTSRPSASVRPSSSVNGTAPSASATPTQEGPSAGVALSAGSNAIVALAMFVAAAFVLA